MKGILFNAIESAVTGLYSEDVWEDLLSAAGLEGSYTAVGSYDDAELDRLVKAAMDLTGMDQDDLIRVLGRHSFAFLADRHADLLRRATGIFDLLHMINDVIHPEVLKLHPDASPPRFEISQPDASTMRVVYQSERRLGALAEGLILGGADRYDQEIEIKVIDDQGSSVTFDICLLPRPEPVDVGT